MSLFQQNKTNVSFREIARLIARNSFKISRGRAVCQSVNFFSSKFNEENLDCNWQSLSQQ